METKINLLGIVRNTSNLDSPAGSCQEIINLRKKYGTWRPILPKLAVKTNFTSTSNTVFIHSMDEATYFIIYDPGDGTIKAHNSSSPFASIQTLLTIASKPASVKFDMLGYYLIVSDLTAYDKYIFRCYPSLATKYKNVSNVPSIDMTLTLDPSAITNEYLTKKDNDSFQAGWWLQEEYFRSLHAEYFEGYVFLRYAIELIDGTVLKHSKPLFLYVGNVTSTLGASYVTILAELIRIKYTIQASLPSDWSNYADLIRGISIFMTKPVSKYDLASSGFNLEETYLGLAEKPNLLLDLFRNESAYYRVHHIPYNKITAGGFGSVGTSKPMVTFGGLASPFTLAISQKINWRGDSQAVLDAERYTSQQNRAVKDNPALFNVNDITSYDILSVDDVSLTKKLQTTAS